LAENSETQLISSDPHVKSGLLPSVGLWQAVTSLRISDIRSDIRPGKPVRHSPACARTWGIWSSACLISQNRRTPRSFFSYSS